MVTEVEKWGNSHRPGFLDIFRIALGLYITSKGLYFITHMDELKMTAAGANHYFAGATLAHYVVFAHVLGGPLLAFGIFTRAICVIQLPILIGAVVLVNYPKGFLSVGNHMELEISLIILVGLITFIVFGAGKYSIDEKRRKDVHALH